MVTSPIVKLTRARTLVLMSDIHIGAEEHCEKEFDEALRWVKENDAMLVLNGDIVENAIVSGSSPGEKLIGQAELPTEQMKIAISKFKPLAKKGRIAGITRGNHDARTRREALLDLCDLLAHAIGVDYWGVGGLFRVQAGTEWYHGAMHHGRSGAQNIWLELDKLMKLYPSAEFVACGHNHHLASREVYSIGVSREGSEAVKQRHQIRTGSFLGYPDYVREMALLPQKVGCPILRFEAKSHQFSVDVDTLSWVP